MIWHLFGLCADVREAGVVRGSERIGDEWLAAQIALDPHLDRAVEIADPPGQPFPLTNAGLKWPDISA